MNTNYWRSTNHLAITIDVVCLLCYLPFSHSKLFIPQNSSILTSMDMIWAASWQSQQKACASSEDSDQPGHPPSESSLSAWRELRSLATYSAHIKDSDQTGRMPRLIWVFAGRTVVLLVLSWGGPCGTYWLQAKLVSLHNAKITFMTTGFLVMLLVAKIQ